MIKTIDEYAFQQAFIDAQRANSFSWEGLKALFEYLEDAFDGADQPYELDVVVIDCEFCEYDSLEEFQGCYGAEDFPDMDAVRNVTCVIEWGADAFIVGEF